MKKTFASIILVIAVVALAGCDKCFTDQKMPTKFEFSDGLKKEIAKVPDDAAILVLTRDGNKILMNKNGQVGKKCVTPKIKKDKNAKRAPNECLGVGKGYITEDAETTTALFSRPNPHGCEFCIDIPLGDGIWWEYCYPEGCDNH